MNSRKEKKNWKRYRFVLSQSHALSNRLQPLVSLTLSRIPLTNSSLTNSRIPFKLSVKLAQSLSTSLIQTQMLKR